MLLYPLVIKMEKSYKWYKLDTAANMFASIQTKDSSRVFRISYVLKNEEVNPEILKIAVKDTLKRFPSFSTRCKEGFFWAYLEHTDTMPEVCEESEMPAAIQNHGRNGGPDLRVLYYKRRISVEIAHIITDGDGAFEFTKSLVAHYINLVDGTANKGESITSTRVTATEEESENAYKRYHNGKAQKIPELTDTYAFSEKLDRNYVKVISGIMPVKELKERCHFHGVTVTEYFCAAAIYAAIKAENKPINNHIRISVPINLRKDFPSKTMRNFACDTTLSFSPEGRSDYSFDEIIKAIKGEIRKSLYIEKLQNFINSNYNKTVNPILRIVPYPIKKAVLNSSQIKNHINGMTTIISNVGIIDYPEWVLSRIERVDIISGNGTVYGLPIISTCVTVGGYLNFCYSQCFKNTDFCKEFFRVISSDGVAVRIETSDGNGYDETRRNAEGKRCKECDIDLGEEYTICPLCGKESVNEEKKIKDFVTAPYPLTFTQPTHKKAKIKEAPLSAEKLKAFFNI